MTTTYAHIELEKSIATKVFYAEGESRERMNSFGAVAGWEISREGDTVTIARGDAIAHLPWDHVSSAIPFSVLDGWKAVKGDQGAGKLIRGVQAVDFIWANATPTIRALGEPATKPESPAAKAGAR